MNKDQIEILGDNHISTSVETPLRPDAFEKFDDESYKAFLYNTFQFKNNPHLLYCGYKPTLQEKS